MLKRWVAGALLLIISSGTVFGQCQPLAGTDAVDAKMDPEGYISLYNGQDLTGWWINCKSHGTTGGDWKVENGIIVSDQKSGGDGGLLYTNKRYKNLDIIVEVWPGWGNDGGMFFRANGNGPAYQIVIDYKAGKTVGGIWGEDIYNINHKPYFFENAPNDIRVGNVTNPVGGAWTDERWNSLWNIDDFNFIRGVVVGRPPNIKAYINGQHITDYNAPQVASQLQDDGYFGLQIHGGTENWGQDPNRYRSIRVKELDDAGQPMAFPEAPVILTQPVPVSANPGEAASFSVDAEFGTMLNYQWQKDGVDIPGAIEATFNIPTVSGGDAGSYTVLLSNQIGPNTTISAGATLSVAGTALNYLNGVQPGQINMQWQTAGSLKISGFMENPYKLKIINVSGSVLLDTQGLPGDVHLELNTGSSGMMFLVLETAGSTTVRKLVGISSF